MSFHYRSIAFLFIGIFLCSCATQQNIWTVEEPKEDFIIIEPILEPQRSPEQGLNHEEESTTKIHWDKWGVPHIYAVDNLQLFYAFGWSQMHSHANTILKLYAKSRGRASEYFGESYIQNDMIVHTLGFDQLAQTWYDKQTPEFKSYINEFVNGLNAYAQAYPEMIDEEMKDILPVAVTDVTAHTLFVTYTVFMGRGSLSQSKRWENVGSNAYAIAPSRSASGKAMLVQNPHLPWFDEYLFYEAHFNAPGVHAYGAALVGLPVLGIAFNEYLGWTHTVNTIDNADLYELQLKDGGYVVDGEVRSFTQNQYTLKIKGDNGQLIEKQMTRTVSPDHGPVIKQSGDKAITLKMPGYDRPHGGYQWWKMLQATNLGEFKNAVDELQLPYFNIIYADRHGEIFYMFNGLVPKRKVGGWKEWSGIVDGSTSENIWTDIHTYEDLPKTENPSSGFLQNANDPPWSSTFPMTIDPADYPDYMSPKEMNFRPQRAVRMIAEDQSITYDELVDYKMSTHLEMADRILDDLNIAVEQYGSKLAKEAMTVLNQWDRKADPDSKGMALFYAWAHSMNPWDQKNYVQQWSADNPRNTPDGLADGIVAVKTLEGVAKKMKDNGLPLDLPWGLQYRIKYADKALPGHGADGSVGIFRVAWSNGLEKDGKYYISGGDSWQSVIEFGPEIKAKVLMSYGNSTQKGNPNFGDQLELFAKKQLRKCTFYKSDVLMNTVTTEILTDSGFVKQ